MRSADAPVLYSTPRRRWRRRTPAIETGDRGRPIITVSLYINYL